MYAALRSKVKSRDDDYRLANSEANDNNVTKERRNLRKAVADSFKWGSEKSPPISSVTSTKAPTASSSRCQTTKPTIVDEWEILDKTLGDTHHYFSRQSPTDKNKSAQSAQLESRRSQTHCGMNQERHTGNRTTSLGGTQGSGYHRGESDWKSLPDKSSKHHFPIDKIEIHQNHKSSTSTQQSDSQLESDDEDKDEPLTTLDSIIAAAKRLSVSASGAPSSASSSKEKLSLLEHQSWRDHKSTPLPKRMDSLNSDRCGSGEPSDRLRNGECRKSATEAIKNQDTSSDCESEKADSLDDGSYSMRKYPNLSRGFTWNSTASTPGPLLFNTTLSELKRLNSFLGSLDTESLDY